MLTDAVSSLNALLAELETAIRASDHFRAHTLAQKLRLLIANDANIPTHVEGQLRTLLAELTVSEPPANPILEVITGERGAHSSKRQLGVVYPVWFGTDRRPSPSGDGFTHERHRSMTLGRVHVQVPAAHRFGESGSSFWTRLRRLDFRDDRLRIERIEKLDSNAFFAELQQTMAAAREEATAPHALLFLHGYNNTFEDAAIRAAQIGYDLKVPGATAFFSWPSHGSVRAYSADEAAIEASEPAITAFLVEFAAHCGAEKIHVIAHSMGNRGLLRALQRIAANAETRGKIKLGQIFLAAPDVDSDLFLNLARLYPEHSERTTLYASDADRAVFASSWLHNAPRAGYFPPYTVAPGIDTIAVPDFNLEFLGHSYFAQAEALLHDIFQLMRHGEAPGLRQRLAPASYEGVDFWQLRR